MVSQSPPEDQVWPDADPAASGPVPTAERLVTLDFIRGIAVVGILAANIVGFSAPPAAYSWPGAYPQPMGRTGDLVWLAQYLLIDGKMRGLFSLLFGASMMLFMERAWARGASRWLQARRLIWLGLFGLAHMVFLYWGDILYLYAFAGLVALVFVHHEPDKLLGLGLAWYVAGAVFLSVTTGASALAEHSASQGAASSADAAQIAAAAGNAAARGKRELAAYSSGSYPAELAFFAREHSNQLVQQPVYALLETVPLMLIGMALYNYGLFGGERDSRRLRKWAWAGIVAGLALTLPLGLWAVAEGFPYFLTKFVFDGIVQFPHLPMVLGLVVLLALWAPGAAKDWLGVRFVAAGRMAFSNYIGTSLVMMLIFRHWALGYYGELSRVQLLIPMALGWVLILAWSKPWLKHFRYGPLEWLWRCLTYWRVFPLRR